MLAAVGPKMVWRGLGVSVEAVTGSACNACKHGATLPAHDSDKLRDYFFDTIHTFLLPLIL